MADKGTPEFLTSGIVVDASTSVKHTATVVFLHGLGDTGDGFAFTLNNTKQPYVKLICPTASKMPVTINQGYVMPSWFDVYGLNKTSKPDMEGIKKAAAKVHELLDYEIETTGVPSDRIILGGISQGGCLAMYSALTYTKPLAGIVALSAWLRNVENEPDFLEKIMANRDTPFLQCHGDADPLVSFEFGQITSDFVKTFNKANHEFRPYPGLKHWICPEEMDYVQGWMNKLLPPESEN